MSTNRLTFSLPESAPWINPAGLILGLAGFIPLCVLFSHPFSNLPILEHVPAWLFVVSLLTFLSALLHESMHYGAIRISSLIRRRIHPDFQPESTRITRAPWWFLCVPNRLNTDMLMPSGILLTIVAVSPLLIGLIAAFTLLFSCSWQIGVLFAAFQVCGSLNDCRLACGTLRPGYQYLYAGDGFSTSSGNFLLDVGFFIRERKAESPSKCMKSYSRSTI
jgi:hypothetical protein